MLLVIDGTGDADDTVYRRDFENSFLRRLWRNYTGRKHYWRGPNLMGLECAEILNETMRYLNHIGGVNEEIIIGGYSRGAAIAIALTHALERHRRFPPALDYIGSFSIPLLILFDAVDRDITMPEHYNTQRIPAIVGLCLHAVRNPLVESRWYFGNCGLDAEPEVELKKQMFYCTHAGMGGTPWTGDHPMRRGPLDVNLSTDLRRPVYGPDVPTITEAQDVENSERIRQWMNRKIALAGLNVNNLTI